MKNRTNVICSIAKSITSIAAGICLDRGLIGSVKDPPYTKYVYKEPDVMLLGEVIAKASGMPLYDFIEKNLYEPLGIQSGRWYQAPCGMTYSVANGDDDEYEAQSNLSAKDLLKIGKLYLQDGVYDGKQILSKEYITECITPSKCEKGYGYMWWLGENWYGCRGYGGQNITVFPKEKVIFIMQATPTSRNMVYYDVFGWICNRISESST